MDNVLASIDDVIRCLGGTTRTAKISGRSAQSVVNWRARGKFPSETYLLLTSHLAARGLIAPPSLWGMETVTPSRDPHPSQGGAQA